MKKISRLIDALEVMENYDTTISIHDEGIRVKINSIYISADELEELEQYGWKSYSEDREIFWWEG